MKQILIYVKGGLVQWTAGSSDISVTIVDGDNYENELGMSVEISASPDVCVPDDSTFRGYVSDDIVDAIEKEEETAEGSL